MLEHQLKFEELNSSIMTLCRINYFAVDLYKQIMDLAKERSQTGYKSPTKDIAFEIIEKVEHFLTNNELDISSFEEMNQRNRDFIDLLIKKKNEISILKDNLLNISSSSKVISINYENKVQMLQPVNSGFNSPSSTSLIQSKSHSRIISNLDDDTKTLNKDLLDCKETILLKNPSISNCSEKQMIKSRNARQTSFCSKTLKESDKFNSSRGIGEEKSIKQFDRKIFLTEESQKRKMINLNDNEPQLWSVIELENCKSNMLTFCDNYEKLSNWILELRDVRHDLHVENCIFELCTQNKEQMF